MGVASRWHTDGIAGHNLVGTEEDYNIYKIGSFFFMMGRSSWTFLHGEIQMMMMMLMMANIEGVLYVLWPIRYPANSIAEVR